MFYVFLYVSAITYTSCWWKYILRIEQKTLCWIIYSIKHSAQYISVFCTFLQSNQSYWKTKHLFSANILFACFLSFMELSTHCLIDFLFLSLELWSFVVLGQVICVFLVWWLLEYGLLPQIWGKVGICLGDSSIGGLSCKRQNKELT